MTAQHNNIVLIGMPGSGKSTVGVILAKMTSRDFVDTDVLIQTHEGRSLQDIVDTEGHLVLRQIEERILLDLQCREHVVATGGSAAYSHRAMEHLKRRGVVVFLDADLPTLRARVRDFSKRGLAKRPEQTFEDLFHERFVLYTRYADLTITCAGLTQEEVCAEIIDALERRECGKGDCS